MEKKKRVRKGKQGAAEKTRRFISEFTLKRGGAVLLCGFLCACLAYGAVKTFARPTYSSFMTLAVINPTRKGDSNINNLAVCYRLADSLANAGSENRAVARRTILRLGYDDMEVDELLEKVLVYRVEKSMMVKVRGTDQDSEAAKEIAEAYAEEMVDELSEELRITNVEVLEGPTKPTRRVGARTVAFAGGAFGVLLALLCFYLKSASTAFVRDAEDLRPSGKPVIGQIPTIPGPDHRAPRREKGEAK